MSNTIIIGNGPAGISAALYTTRAGIETTVIGKDYGALKKAHEIENYYGFSSPISGNDLITNGIDGAKRLGANIINDEVVGISYGEKLIVKTKENEFMADTVLIATGTNRVSTKIKGIKELEGKGVSYCAVCDAFFYKNKDVAVIGNGSYALHEALELLPTSSSVTVLTNGMELEVDFPDDILIDKRKISNIKGDEIVEGVLFEDGELSKYSALFIALGTASSVDLAKKIGAETSNNKITVDNTMATNIPGIYAAGDCTGGLLQISKAVYEGAVAGTEIIKYIRSQSRDLKQVVNY